MGVIDRSYSPFALRLEFGFGSGLRGGETASDAFYAVAAFSTPADG